MLLRTLLALVTAIPFGAAAGAPGAADEPVRLQIELSDGSVLVGIPAATSVAVRTSYARMTVGLAQIRAMQVSDDHETAVLQFANGDHVTGVLDGVPMKLATVAGDISVEMQYVKRVTVRAGKAGGGLVLHYSFDEDGDGVVRDRSGSGNDGRIVGSVTYEDSRSGKAVRFSSRDTYIVADSSRLNMNGWKEMSVAVWVRIWRYTTYGHVINRGPVSGTTGGAFELGVGQNYGKSIFGVHTSAADGSGVSMQPQSPGAPPDWGQPLEVGRWYHLALTYDSRTVRYYIDGVQQVAIPVPVPGTPLWDGPENKLVIGTVSRQPFISWYDMYFDGLVDDARVYDRCLAPGEIEELGRGSRRP